MHKQLLHADWSVRPVSNLDNVPAGCRGATPAAVPGCVHTDLLRAGKIPDPYYDRNEPTLQWIGQTDWRYEGTFTADAELFKHERIDLAADGLDTVATVELNGQLIAKTENMHVGYRFDVRPHLKQGKNTLTITFASAERYALAMEERLGKLPFTNTRVPFNMIRKMACNFGWDWGPEVITCGIWRPIRLEGWSVARLTDCLPLVRHPEEDRAVLELKVNAESPFVSDDPHGPLKLHIKVTSPSGRIETHDWPITYNHVGTSITQAIEIRSPELWWPIGHGEQPLYRLDLQLFDEHGAILDQQTRRVGLRTVELDTSPDDIGSAFTLKVNGKPIFCKGFNWIPDDAFLDRACTPERYRKRIQDAIDANANMLRVWGGGIFETEAFYDICDELGVLVWQDFLFACAAYAEEEPMRSLVEQEVRYNVARLSHHASLAIWNGCNENVWGYHDWGWKHKGLVKDRTWGPGYYFDLLPKIIDELDPTRPYWGASPWSGDADWHAGLHPNLASHGNKHVWEVWSDHYKVFRNVTPRFCSEFGFQAPPTYATLAECMPVDQIAIGSESMLMHQKSPGWNTNTAQRVVDIFGPGERGFDDQHYLLQVNQARALQLGVEWFRSRAPVCMGTLYWQLNDNYPVTSWSAVDWAGRYKPLWYATRRFYAPRLLTIQPRQDMLELCAINDTDEAWQATVDFTVHGMAGGKNRVKQAAINVPPRSVQRLPLAEASILRVDAPNEYLVAQAGPQRAFWFYGDDRTLNYPEPKLTADVSRRGDVTQLTITAQTLVRDLLIQVDRLDPAASISDNLLTLPPGETVTLDIRTAKALSAKELLESPVLLTANRFGFRPVT